MMNSRLQLCKERSLMNIPHSYNSSGLSILHGNRRTSELEWQNERMREWESEIRELTLESRGRQCIGSH